MSHFRSREVYTAPRVSDGEPVLELFG